jgi:hypothetical protein
MVSGCPALGIWEGVRKRVSLDSGIVEFLIVS